MLAKGVVNAFLSDRGWVFPADIDLVILVGGSYILGYMGWLAFKLFTNDGKTPPIDAASERNRRRAGICFALLALVYVLVRLVSDDGLPTLHRPMALLNIVAAFALGNFTGALTGVVVSRVSRTPDKENSVGGFQTLVQGIVLATMFATAWATAGHTPSSQSAGCKRVGQPLAGRFAVHHPEVRLIVCPSGARETG
jgi:hypothetical protein